MKSTHVPRLRSNIIGLTISQISNYIVPVASTAYVSRALGSEAFGKVALAQAATSYLILLVEYGFPLSASRKIADCRSDSETYSRIFISTWFAQLLLVILGGVAGASIVIFNKRAMEDWPFYASAFTIVIGTGLFPIWLLQGLERLKEAAFIQTIAKILSLFPIFFFIKSPADAVSVLLIQGFAGIATGITTLTWLHYSGSIYWHLPRFTEIGQALLDGFSLFISRLSVSFYTSFIPLALGIVAGPEQLGMFNLADKIRTAAQSLTSPFSQALFPRISSLAYRDPGQAFHIIKQSSKIMIALSAGISLFLFFGAHKLVDLMGGAGYKDSSAILEILSPLPLIIVCSNILGVQMMLPRRKAGYFNTIVSSGAIFALAITWPMINKLGSGGAACVILMTESLISIAMLAYCARVGLLSLENWKNYPS